MLKQTNYMNRIGNFTDMVRLQRCFEMVYMPKIPANLDRYSLYHSVSTAGKRKYGRDVQATSAISRPLADDFLLWNMLNY